MDFSWSTPLRHDGRTSLPLIPNEIYLAIFEYIAPTSEPIPERLMETFSALALVCRFFCAVALPRVFECVEFSGDIAGNRLQACRKTTWVKQIVANTEPARSVALYVRECYFKDWRAPKEMQGFLFPFSTLYCQAMACMTNIRTVEFYRSSVKKGHWDAMAALKQLDCLVFYDCTFAENPPDQELCVRTVQLAHSPTSFTLWPIATSTLRTLDADELESVLKLVTARHLTIEKLFLHNVFVGMELLFVLEKLPGLERLIFKAKEDLETSPSVSGLLLKKLFTRLCSFTMIFRYVNHGITRDYTEKLISSICDGPGTLSSLEELNLLFFTSGGQTTTLDIVSDSLEGTIIPAFPNLKRIRVPGGDLRLEKGCWKCYEAPFFRTYHAVLIEFG